MEVGTDPENVPSLVGPSTVVTDLETCSVHNDAIHQQAGGRDVK